MAIADQILGSIFASISAESWRLAFLMQVLFACFTVIAIYKHFPDEKHNNQNKKIDFVVLTLLGLSISTLFILSEIFLKNVAITTKLVLTMLIIIFISLLCF
ncbi:MAG: hypothetical protein AB8V06_05075 [Francisella endosymbiont of Hyalomma asiaticum]